MPTFRDCIMSAQQQGVLSEDEAESLIGRYDEHRKARRGAGDADPDSAARTALAGELDAVAARKKELAALAEKNRDDLKGYLETYRSPAGNADVFGAAMNLLENHGYGAATSSLAGAAKAKFSLAMGEVSDALSAFRKSRLTGMRFNKPGADDVIREMLGETTGKPEARAMASSFSDLQERLRGEFNALGGNIGKLENYAPQDHSPGAVLAAGFKKWHDDIVPKLDLERMRDPLTEGALSPERLDATLKVAWEHITTGGWSDREPSAQPFGLGALANQRQEHRFLHFKSADDWLAYNKDYGSGDPVAALLKHVKGMTSDIAAMERLGPNPSATVEWLKQVVNSEAAKFLTEKPTLHAGGPLLKVQDKMGFEGRQLQATFDYLQGDAVASRRVATGFGDIRNIQTSAQLGGASILAAMQDPFIDMSARHLSGLPVARAVLDAATTFSKSKRENAVRAGLGLDDVLHIGGAQARYAGDLGGGEITRWLAERTVNWNGLEPITQSRKHGFGLDFMAAVADRRNLSFDELGNEFPAMRRTFEDYGLGEKEWNTIREVEPFIPAEGSAGHLRPADVAEKDRGVAERYLEMILQQTERAVPTGTARSKSFSSIAFNRGTVAGELAASALQYKTFTLSFMTNQMQAVMTAARGGDATGLGLSAAAMVARGAGYAASLAIPMTLAGGLALQIKNVTQGRDLQAMDAPFWTAALQYGGGLGILGDFLLSDLSRFGHTVTETLLGPTFGLIADVADPVIRNAQKGFRNLTNRQTEKTTMMHDAVNFAGRYTPIVSSLFYTRAAYRRMFIDQLQYLADPEAHQKFRQQEQTLHRQTGQGFFWRPGQTLPERMPVLSDAKQ